MNLEIDYLWSHKCPKKWNQYTLIALVITIIVLLILAGVTIATLAGDNGLLTKAINAVEKNRDTAVKEDVEIAWEGATIKYWNDWKNNSSIVSKLAFYKSELEDKNTSLGVITSISDGENEGTYEVEYKANDQNQPYIFIIDVNGKAREVKRKCGRYCK